MILHAVPNFIGPDYGCGNWKAVEATKILLASISVHTMLNEFDPSHPCGVVNEVKDPIQHCFIEYSLWPELVRALKQKYPFCRVHVRTHNAEAFQHWHRSNGKWPGSMLRPKLIYGCARLLYRDGLCRVYADSLLGINAWENRNYWRWLPGKAKIYEVPYFSPWPYLRSEIKPKPWLEREPILLALPGGSSPYGLSMIEGLAKLATMLGKINERTYKAVFTFKREWYSSASPEYDNLQRIDDCKEPWDLLCNIRVAVVLGLLGFGTKTTVYDAIAAGCRVILHPVLAKRLPIAVARYCDICDPDNLEQVKALKSILHQAPTETGLNSQLKDQAASELRKLFLN